MLTLEPTSQKALYPAPGFSNNKNPFVTLNLLIKVSVTWLGSGPMLVIRDPKLSSICVRRIISFQNYAPGHWTNWIPTALADFCLIQDLHKTTNCFCPFP